MLYLFLGLSECFLNGGDLTLSILVEELLCDGLLYIVPHPGNRKRVYDTHTYYAIVFQLTKYIKNELLDLK